MNSFQDEIKKLKKEITFTHIAVSVLSVIVFFVIPCIVIGNFTKGDSSQSKTEALVGTTNTTAKVAGASTTKGEVDNTLFVPVLNVSINLNSQSGLFIIFGLILLSVSIILILFLYMDKDKLKHKKFKY